MLIQFEEQVCLTHTPASRLFGEVDLQKLFYMQESRSVISLIAVAAGRELGETGGSALEARDRHSDLQSRRHAG